MKRRLLYLLAAALILTSLAGNLAFAADWIWAKGNLHTHTTNSDGDSAPQAVADWYKDHDYQFLFITDHGTVTDAVPLDKDPNDQYILMPGEELGVTGKGLPIHANALGISQAIASLARVATPGRSVRNLVEYVRDSGAIPMVNHPNWRWSLSHRELLQIQGPYLLEIANMGGGCNNDGSLSWLPTEQAWDFLLSEGEQVYATATDDMHRLKPGAKGDLSAGKGWVVTRVAKLTPTAVLAALAKGDFYASTGVELADYSFDGEEFRISVASKEDRKYVIRFVGKWGSILQETVGTIASYKIAGKPEVNSYIRCKVIASDGAVAWTQAFRIGN